MTPLVQRIKIAEACRLLKVHNWNATDSFGNTGVLVESPNGIYGLLGNNYSSVDAAFIWPPDYLNDLNAMHEAEKVLTSEQRGSYAGAVEAWTDPNVMTQICIITGDPYGTCDYGVLFKYLHATAAQRAEAFLKTLNLWTP